MITSVVTADFDCMQFSSRAKAFSFPFSTVAIFWLLDWLWSFRFIAINGWIILLKSGNQNIKGAIHSTKISGNFGPKLNGSVRSNRKSFEKTGPPFEVVLFCRSDRSEFWLNGSRPKFLSNHLPFLKRLPTVTSPQSTVILL